MADFDSVMAQFTAGNVSNGSQNLQDDPGNFFTDAERATAMEGVNKAPTFRYNPATGVTVPVTPDMPAEKKSNVAAASERKQVAMGKPPQLDPNPYQTAVGNVTGQGLDSMTGIERDMRILRPSELQAKYGQRQAAALMQQANTANQDVFFDRTANRSGFEAAWDTAVDIGSGFVMPALNIGAFGLGVVNDKAGAAASLGLEKLNNLIRTEGQSDELGQRRKVNEARNALDSRDSELIQKQQLASGTGEIMAGLNRLGRGIANSVSNATDDSAILGSGLASGVGSLLAGGPLAKGATKVGEAALAGLGRAGVIKSGGPISSGLTTSELSSAVRASAFPATIGTMEASSVYQQTVADSYKKLIDQGKSHEQAVEDATDAGTMAFIIAFPAAVGLSKLVQGFEQNPFAKTSIKQAVVNALKEKVEEGGQSGTGRLAQNIGTKEFVDPNQQFLDQVGEQAGEGGLYGMGTSLAISGPGATLASTGDTAKYLWGKASTAAANSAAKTQAANEATAPLAPAQVAAQVAATQAAMPAAAAAVASVINPATVAPSATGTSPRPVPMAPEAQAATQAYADKLMNALNYDDEAKSELAGHPLYRNIQNHTNKADAMMTLAGIVNDAIKVVGPEAMDDPTIFDAAQMLNNYVADLEEAMRDEPDTLSSLPANHPAVKHLDNIKKTFAAVNAQPAVKAALAIVNEAAQRQQTADKVAAITSESLATPEGQQAAQSAVNAIAHDPAKANQDLVNVVLKHASTGEITLTKKQQKALSLAITLFDMAREDFANRQKLGLLTQDIVSNQIQSAEYLGDGQLSAVQHATAIHDAYKANDMGKAKYELEDFRKFAESIQNKLTALNKHLNSPKGSNTVPYQTIDQTTRKWKTAPGVGVTPTSENSVSFMQQVAADAKMLSDTYSHLQKIFPELNGAKLTPVKVDSRMNHPTVDVVKAFRTGVQPAKPIPATKEKPAIPESTQRILPLVPTPEEKAADLAARKEAADKVIADRIAAFDARTSAPKENQKEKTTPASVTPTVEPKKVNTPTEIETNIPTVEPEQETKVGTFDKKGLFTVNPSQSADKKAVIKASIATQYIGYGEGIPRSSTELYRQQAGKFANTGDYSTDDVIFVSVGGNRGPVAIRTAQQDRSIAEALSAIEDGATLITDNTAYVQSSDYNSGEKRLAEALRKAGHTYSEQTVDGQLLGVWNQGKKLPDRVEPTVEYATPDGVQPELTGLAKELSHLFGSVKTKGRNFVNRMTEAFSLPDEPISRVSMDETPMSTVFKALKSESALAELMGTTPKPGYQGDVNKAYRIYMRTIGVELKKAVEDSLVKFLSTRQDKILSEKFKGYRNGKLLNIVQEVDGTLKYDRVFLEGAVLAGLQWLLTSDQATSPLTNSSLARSLKVEEGELPEGLANSLSYGQSELDATKSLTRTIQAYWGLKSNKDVPVNVPEGIAGSMASEILNAFESMGILQYRPNFFTEDLQLLPLNKENVRLVPEGAVKFHHRITLELEETSNGMENYKESLMAYPNAIEQAVMVKPESTVYLEDERPDIARTQLRNPQAKNSKSAQTVIKKNQDQAYKFSNQRNLYDALGMSGMLNLFGFGDLTEDDLANRYNKNHVVGIDGKNKSVISAVQGIENLYAQVQARAASIGKTAEEIGVHFAMEFSKVQRAQMMGRVTPQGDKSMRVAITPHDATLNLNKKGTPDHNAFLLAIAQSIGIKIHQKKHKLVFKEVQAQLDGGLKPVVTMLQEWLPKMNQENSLQENAVDIIKDAFESSKADLTNLSLQAMTEYAQYKNTTQNSKARKEFKSALNIEADGMSNGPVGAQILHTTGPFTEQQLRMWSKGGYYPGQEGRTSQDHFADDNVDTYGVIANSTKDRVNHLKNILNSESAEFGAHMDHLTNLMNVLFNGDVKVDNGVLTIKRGAAKSPVTVTLYGAGKKGIATKIVGIITDSLYEKMSQAANALYEDPNADIESIMFGSPENYVKFTEDWHALTNKFLVFSQSKNKHFLIKSDTYTSQLGRITHKQAVDFTVSPDSLSSLNSNILQMFVKPMDEATRDQMGKPLMDAMELIRMSTQMQSVFLEDAFKKEVEAALERKKDDPLYQPGDFLSQRELDAITSKLKYMMPLIQNEDQNFYIAGSASSDIGDQLDFGMGFNERFKTPAYAFGPKDSGVGGIAAINIGGVDGQMIQNFYNKFPTDGTLPVFDGINLPLDKQAEYSKFANQSIFEAWMGNPMKAIHESYEVFTKDANMDLKDIKDNNEALYKKIAQVVYGPRVDMDGVVLEDLTKEMTGIQQRLRRAAIFVQARHNVMKKIGASVDQMASSASPYWHQGTVDVSGLNPTQMVERMNQMLEEEIAALAPEYTKDETTLKTIDGMEDHLAIYNVDDLKYMATKMNLPADQKKMLNELIYSGALEGWTFINGPMDKVKERAITLGVGSEMVDNLENGLTLPGHKLILLANKTSETLIHEMWHAATFATAHAHYAGTLSSGNAPVVAATIARLEGMMNQFVNLADELPALSFETRQQYNHARSVIEANMGNPDPIAKATALNEFMAYTLSNQVLIRLTGNTKVSKLHQIVKSVLKMIKEVLFGKRSLYVSDDMFTNVRFNSVVLAKLQPSVLAQLTVPNAALPHYSPASGARLIDIRTNFLNRIGANLRQPTTYNNLGRTAAQMQAVKLSAEAALAMNNHGFQMSPLETSTFTSIVQALATQAKIDPNTMARAQELFNLTTKAMTVDMFIEPDHDPHVAQYYANEKYRAVLGDYTQGKDAFGRSTLLPIFLGLSMTNNKFREVLSKIDITKSKLKKGETLDETLENVGNTLIDKLSNRLSGQGKHQPDVQAAIDALTTHLLDQAQDDKSWAEQALSEYGNKVNGINDWVVDKLSDSADFFTKQATKLRSNNTNLAKKTLATLADTTAAIISEKSSDAVAQSVVTMINNLNGFRTFREVVADIVGRTESNAELYDQNKLVRAMVSQDRQHYREDLPKELLTHFKEEVSKEQLTAMFHGIAKTDIASLFPVMSFNEVRELFTKPSALSKRINDLESSIKSADPAHWNKVQVKAAQLATYMTTGAYGSNLLRNARAVSNLFGETTNPRRVAPTDAYIKNVDALISLYAVDNLSKENQKILSSLVQDESEGVDFIMSYLIGQQAEEMRKIAGSKIAQDNYFKGFIPSAQESGVNLIVAEDSRYPELKIKSFTEVASYSGSSLAFGAPKSYFFAKVAGRSPYNQGAMQNARQTANGIDLATGFTDGLMTAGRITDRQIVAKIVSKMGQERPTAEPLMPLYVDGQVFAFERSVDPLQLVRLNQNTDITEMIGVWRGRQVEEAKVQIFNEALVDAAKKMYKDDIQLGRKTEYINVFDPKEQKKDPVMADAVKLLNPDTRTYLEAVFGKDNFPVRKDMLNDMLGYRGATVGDMWSGNHRWSKQTEEAVRNIAITMFGNKAYEYMTKAESAVQGVVSSAKTLIVMKSVVVPISNIIGNVYQLMSRGVPLMSIGKGMPRKFAEIEAYTKSRKREVAVEAQIRAAVASSDVRTEGKLRVELQSIKDSYERLSIAPLIKAGQFSAISDMGLTKEDVELSQGKLTAYVENLVDKLPESVRNAGRYALITKDTALFQGIQKAVDYGDFIAKAILYDDLTQRKGLTKEAALARIMEEFVNYDRLPGRSRGYLESVGLLWFYNFKLRLVKIALSTIRNNPVHALMVGMAPKPTFFGSIGTPISDNFLTMGVNGELGASVGIGMALNAPTMNPFVSAVY